MTPAQKLEVSIKLYEAAKTFKAAGIKELHPDWNEKKIKKMVNEFFYMPEPKLYQVFVGRFNVLGIRYMLSCENLNIIEKGNPRSI